MPVAQESAIFRATNGELTAPSEIISPLYSFVIIASMDHPAQRIVGTIGTIIGAATVIDFEKYSLGVNIFFALNRKLAALMAPINHYAVRMNEIHHTRRNADRNHLPA